MARRPRFHLPGVPVHAIQRGNDRSRMFPDEAHRHLYLGLLQELAPQFGCGLHAYVLMTNHVHLLLTPQGADGPSRLMKHLGQRYVQHFNRVHRHTGSRLDGRYYSHMVGDDGNYFLICQRYIELNPVRARMVGRPGEYAWSSYRSHAYGLASALLMPHVRYAELGRGPDERCLAYGRLVARGISEEDIRALREAARTGVPWGSREFVARATTGTDCRWSVALRGFRKRADTVMEPLFRYAAS